MSGCGLKQMHDALMALALMAVLLMPNALHAETYNTLPQLGQTPSQPSPQAVISAISVILQEPLSTKTVHFGQEVILLINGDLYQGDSVLLRRGDKIVARVSQLSLPQPGLNATLGVSVHAIQTQLGQTLPISGWVDTGNEQHVWGGEVTEGTKPTIVPYHIYQLGSYGRVMYHGPKKMGQHVQLAPGTRLVVILSEPLPVQTTQKPNVPRPWIR